MSHGSIVHNHRAWVFNGEHMGLVASFRRRDMVTAHCIEMVSLNCRIILSLYPWLFGFSLVRVMLELLWILLLRGVQVLIALLAALVSDRLMVLIVGKLLDVRWLQQIRYKLTHVMSLLLLNTTGRVLLVNYGWVLDLLLVLVILGWIVTLFIRFLLVVRMGLLLRVVLIDVRLLIL